MIKYILSISLLMMFISCDNEVRLPPLKAEEISGTRLWERISSDSEYSTYSFWPGHEGINPGQAPHGVYHRIYINGDLLDALPVDSRIAPMGTIIVKENMDRDKQVQKITVMAKIDGYNDEGGNWFWAAYSPEGDVLAEGTPKGCVSCHEGMKGNDYVIVRPLDHKN
jgi:Cytochrome P460